MKQMQASQPINITRTIEPVMGTAFCVATIPFVQSARVRQTESTGFIPMGYWNYQDYQA